MFCIPSVRLILLAAAVAGAGALVARVISDEVPEDESAESSFSEEEESVKFAADDMLAGLKEQEPWAGAEVETHGLRFTKDGWLYQHPLAWTTEKTNGYEDLKIDGEEHEYVEYVTAPFSLTTSETRLKFACVMVAVARMHMATKMGATVATIAKAGATPRPSEKNVYNHHTHSADGLCKDVLTHMVVSDKKGLSEANQKPIGAQKVESGTILAIAPQLNTAVPITFYDPKGKDIKNDETTLVKKEYILGNTEKYSKNYAGMSTPVGSGGVADLKRRLYEADVEDPRIRGMVGLMREGAMTDVCTSTPGMAAAMQKNCWAIMPKYKFNDQTPLWLTAREVYVNIFPDQPVGWYFNGGETAQIPPTQYKGMPYIVVEFRSQQGNRVMETLGTFPKPNAIVQVIADTIENLMAVQGVTTFDETKRKKGVKTSCSAFFKKKYKKGNCKCAVKGVSEGTNTDGIQKFEVRMKFLFGLRADVMPVGDKSVCS